MPRRAASKAAGIYQGHAEAIAEAQAKVTGIELASKADIARLQADIANRDNRLAWRLTAAVDAAIVILLSAFGVAVALLGSQ